MILGFQTGCGNAPGFFLFIEYSNYKFYECIYS